MTIKEVAALAGVSPAAVSRYLNGGSLSEEKHLIIQKTIEETGYRPTVAARMLRSGSRKQIGIIVPKIYSDSVALITEGITDAIQKYDYVGVMGDAHANEQKELDFIAVLEANQAAGVIIMGTTVTPRLIDAYKASKIPIVITGQNVPGMPCVYHDDYHASKELTERFFQKGRQHVVYLGVPDKDPQAGKARRKGAFAAFAEAGIPEEEIIWELADFNPEAGYTAMERALKRLPQMDGVMCATDTIAFGAMRALMDAGRMPGRDVSIAGVGDSWMDEYSLTPLTTAHYFYRQCGGDAAAMLIQMIDAARNGEPAVIRQTCLDYEIIDRGSI